MFQNYLKIALRSLVKNRLFTMINVLGLGVGFAATILIACWLADERGFNAYNPSYEELGMLWKNQSYNGSISTTESNPVPLGETLRTTYGQYFDEVVVSSFGGERALQFNEANLICRGLFMEKGGDEILGLELVNGAPRFPLDPTSILINEKTATALFGQDNPLDKTLKIDNKISLTVAGVFKDLPLNSTFRSVSFYASFEAFANMEEWVMNSLQLWSENSFPVYVKMAQGVGFETASAAIANVLQPYSEDESKPALFIHPMSKWRLYPAFENGKPVGKGLTNLLIFGSIGFLILLLAIINFVNLVTARASVKAKEIGVRKAVGSSRKGIILLVYSEVVLLVFGAGIIGLGLAQICLGWFNQLISRNLALHILDPYAILKAAGWFAGVVLLAGIYPAFYLSSFHPIKILKGLKVGSPREAMLRKSLVVFQFSISVLLIIAMLVANEQIVHSMNRPIGYDNNRLIQIHKSTPNLRGHFWAMREQLLASGAVEAMAEMNTPLAENWHLQSGINWRGKPQGSAESFANVVVTPGFGKTVNWKITEGRDFDRKFLTDTAAIIINKTAAALIGFKDPVNEYLEFEGKRFTVIGVAEDLVFDSPYENARPTLFQMRHGNAPFVTLKLVGNLSVNEAVKRVEKVMKGFDPNAVLNVKFADEQFESKFWREKMMLEMIGASTIIAIFISCLGLFGLVTFMAAQRTKEIGIRKVLGATTAGIVQLLSKDFLKLVFVALVIASPLAYFFMERWLQDFAYRIDIRWWVFVAAGLAAVGIAFLTVSFQSMKAALANPVKSLRSE